MSVVGILVVLGSVSCVQCECPISLLLNCYSCDVIEYWQSNLMVRLEFPSSYWNRTVEGLVENNGTGSYS
jgi:hypothetical protein